MSDQIMSPEALKPPDLTADAERPQPVQDVPLWSENYLTHAYDPEIEVGFFFHLSRMPFNSAIWEGVFTCYLPGGRYLVFRDFSWDSNPNGPGSNALQYKVLEPFKRWSKRFKGAARLVTHEELHASAVLDDSHVFVDVDLTWEAISPHFDIGAMGEQFWAHTHYEQHGRVTGTVTVDGTHLGIEPERYEFNGTGLRDHSVGKRDIKRMRRHAWFHGQFPSGRNFMVMDLEPKPGEGTNFLYVVVGDEHSISRVELTKPTAMLDEISQTYDAYEIHFVGPDGPTVIKAEILAVCPYSFTGPNEWVLGVSDRAHVVLMEGQTRFEWDGEVGYGLSERSIPLS